MDNARSAPLSWGPDRRLAWIASVVAGCCAVWGAFHPLAEDRLVAAVATVAFALVAVALARTRRRLTADSDGLTIVGPLRTRTVPWHAVVSLTTPLRGRFGRRSATLEIEVLGDDDVELLMFGSFELGADPAEVGRHLRRLHFDEQR